MNWQESVQLWRQLSPEQQREIQRRRLPRKVARSMAFEGEPVSEDMLREHLDSLIQGRFNERDAEKKRGL